MLCVLLKQQVTAGCGARTDKFELIGYRIGGITMKSSTVEIDEQ